MNFLKLIYFLLQPTKLNVYKNDTESWDYTTPALGKYQILNIYYIWECLIYLSLQNIYQPFFLSHENSYI